MPIAGVSARHAVTDSSDWKTVSPLTLMARPRARAASEMRSALRPSNQARSTNDSAHERSTSEVSANRDATSACGGTVTLPGHTYRRRGVTGPNTSTQ